MKSILIAGVVLSLAQISQGCAIMSPEWERDMSVSTTDEAALVVWDEKTKTEHFIRKANFSGVDKEFGFIVPTPSRPSLGEMKDGLFEALEEELKPEIKTEIERVYQLSLLIPITFPLRGGKNEDNATAMSTGVKAIADGADSVEVVQQTRVGDYDATVLRANDATALGEWLRKNSYTAPPSVEKWLQFYTAKKWYLTALRVRANQNTKNASLAPVRISFATYKPFYPYHEPETTQKNQDFRSLRVFFVGNKRMKADVVSPSKSENWSARTTLAAPMKKPDGITAFGGLPTGQGLGTDETHLTSFVDYSSPRRGFGDLYFSPSEDQSQIVPEPIIRYKEQTILIPLDLIALGALGLFLLGRRCKEKVVD